MERTLTLLGPLSERQQKSVRAMAAAIVNKLLHAPTARLRGEQGGPLAEAVAELFGLQDGGNPSSAEPAQTSESAAGERPPAPASEEEAASGADVVRLTGRK